MAGSRSSVAILARLAALTLILISALGTDELRGGAPPYIVTDLGIFGTVQSAQAFDVNDAGQTAGIAGNRAFLWQHGTKTDLGTLGSGSSASALGLNEAGQVVGYSARTTPPTGTHAVLWSNGGIVDLTPDVPANQSASATAINEAGQVVGNVFYTTAFLWQNGTRISLGHLGCGAGAAASDINDTGVVVGSSCTHPFMWQSGVMTDLGVLPGDEDAGAAAINNFGQIVGSSGRTDPDTYETFYHAFIYSGGVMTALPVPSSDAYAGDINDAGVVVGSMRAAGGVSNFHGWVYIDGIVTNLNTLIPAGTGLHIAYAKAINNAGQIAATAFDAQGRYHHRHADRHLRADDLADVQQRSYRDL
jgi:probable HAF family extracellular repeat protein